MKTRFYLWRIAGVVLLLLLAYLFFNIVIYVLISSILFLIGSPITKKMESIKIRGKQIPDALGAALTLFTIAMVVLLLFKMIVPPLITQVNLLSTLNFYDVLHNILAQFPGLDNTLKSFGSANDIKMALSTQLDSFLNFSNVSWVVNNLFSYTGRRTHLKRKHFNYYA
ncbi:MAG: AI-2E family transporter [Sphingobacteriaceae bacterium]|nr:AI-2E family transporter [Sphingobacteriaceae bacterium]